MNSKHSAARHIRNDLEVDGESAKIRFAPEVLQAFAQLEGTVRGSKHFDSDLLVNLQELAAGKDFTARAALANMGLIAQEAAEYINATGDKKAKLALAELFDVLSGMETTRNPVTVLAARKRAR
jgi:hypothetical protein